MSIDDDRRRGHESGASGELSADDFAALFQESWRALWCVAFAVLNDRALAEDVLQESAIIGLRKRGEYTPGTAFVPWMSAIVRFVALNQSRKVSRRKSSSVDPNIIASIAGDGASDPSLRAGAPFDDRLNAALASLNETARECLILRTVFEAPYSEISARLGIPEGTAMSHVHRSRRVLRDALQRGAAAPAPARKARAR